MKAPRKYATNTRTGPVGRPFQSGNPGKPRGARHRTTQAVEALLDGEAEKLTRKAIEMALAGDVTALRLCFERICPPRRDRPVAVELPKIERPADMVTATAALVEAAACGVVTPDTGFSCGDIGNGDVCSCAGPADSRDCRGMKKNCSGPLTCGGLLVRCTCKYTAPFTGIGGGPLHGTPGPKTTFTPPGNRVLRHGTTGVKAQ
jgi:hypothetical protein